ncbi:MAG: 2-C-methyl-D-erythritol 4-phosphate cytidylyltransferase [Endomicrobium sp.]|jgi:2-C-methyl-D-erythritol 4-phosphate cytidylyltransferase|nr:2-C-methyl-D-erythritol 4-phosphate cytidylyltransferase [Endomicrobium sp.]
MKNAVVILAAGFGKRFLDSTSSEIKDRTLKQFLNINGKPVFLWSVETFASIKSFEQIIVAVPPKMVKTLSLEYEKCKLGFVFVSGGNERFESVKNALSIIENDIDFVALHDAARPLISREDILEVLKSAEKTGAAIATEKTKDTIKLVSGVCGKTGRYVLKTLDRTFLRNAQTPQIFEFNLLKRAYLIKKISSTVTDDSQLVEKLKVKVSVVETKFPNFKITTKQDFKIAEALFAFKSRVFK